MTTHITDVEPGTGADPESGSTRVRRRRQVVLAVVTTFLVAVIAAGGVLWSQGWRWYDVHTPSMGTAAPVGTLIITRPTSTQALHVGDIATFHPPSSGEVYSHRIVAKTTDGGLQTRGDVNPGPDAWTIHDSELVGKVVVKVPAAGWLLRGVPLFALILGLWWALSALARPSWRSPLHVIGFSVALAVVALVLKPWVGLVRLGISSADDGLKVRAVSTGLLPIKVTGPHVVSSGRLHNGETTSVIVHQSPSKGSTQVYNVAASLDLSLWWWVLVIAICLAPLIYCLTIGLTPPPLEEGEPA